VIYILHLIGKDERNYLENQGVNDWKTSLWVIKNNMGECELDSSGGGQRPVVGSCEHNREP
jgi:hypothetical protein